MRTLEEGSSTKGPERWKWEQRGRKRDKKGVRREKKGQKKHKELEK